MSFDTADAQNIAGLFSAPLGMFPCAGHTTSINKVRDYDNLDVQIINITAFGRVIPFNIYNYVSDIAYQKADTYNRRIYQYVQSALKKLHSLSGTDDIRMNYVINQSEDWIIVEVWYKNDIVLIQKIALTSNYSNTIYAPNMSI